MPASIHVMGKEQFILTGSRSLWRVFSHAFSAWNDHNDQELGAALAFYTILSLAPLLVLIIPIVSMAYGRSGAENQILGEVTLMIGERGASAVRDIIQHNQQHAVTGTLASVFALVTLTFAASGVFSELQSALNRVWEVKNPTGSRIWELVKERFYSFGMVFAIGFLLVVSLVVSAYLAAIGKFFHQWLPVPEFGLTVIDFLISLIGVAFCFALIFKYVPETRIEWKDVWLGAVATAFLFTIGKSLIGIYLGKATISSAYGAAGSLVVMVVWVYYSAMIFLFGAEFTHVLAGSLRSRRPLAGSPGRVQ